MKKAERLTISDDITYLKDNGMSVKVIEKVTRRDIINALEDPEAKLIMTSGHGGEMNKILFIRTNNGTRFTTKNINKDNVSKNLSTVIFAHCHQGGKINSNGKKRFEIWLML